jgi:hypothetical protein
MLTQGEIPGFLSKEEQDALGEEIIEEAKKESEDPDLKPYQYFVRKVKDRMHIFLAVSPA